MNLGGLETSTRGKTNEVYLRTVHETVTDTPLPGAGRDNGGAWVQITRETRLRATIPTDCEQPIWEGSGLRRRLLLKRTASILVIASVTAWLGWAVIMGINHAVGSYTTTDGIVTAQTDNSGRGSAGCRLDLDYAVNGQQLHGAAKVNADCNTLPKPGSQATLNVATSDPHDIWIDGADDAGHPNPVLFGVFLLIGPPVGAFALWTELTDYAGVRKLIASGAQWRQVGATVTSKTGSRAGVLIRLEAEDLSGTVSSFNIFYQFVSPIGSVRKGDRVNLTLIANGKWQALVWKPDRNRIHLVHVAQPRW